MWGASWSEYERKRIALAPGDAHAYGVDDQRRALAAFDLDAQLVGAGLGRQPPVGYHKTE
jgi:hypothetical protein